jgi:hypothetical protein
MLCTKKLSWILEKVEKLFGKRKRDVLLQARMNIVQNTFYTEKSDIHILSNNNMAW